MWTKPAATEMRFGLT